MVLNSNFEEWLRNDQNESTVLFVVIVNSKFSEAVYRTLYKHTYKYFKPGCKRGSHLQNGVAIRKHVKRITAWVNFVANLNEQMNLQLVN